MYFKTGSYRRIHLGILCVENTQLNNKTIKVLWDRVMQTDKIIWENAEPWTWQFTVLALKGKDKRHACVGLFEQMELSFKQTPGEGRKKKKKARNHHNIWGLKPLHNAVKSRFKIKKRESGRKMCNREEQLCSLLETDVFLDPMTAQPGHTWGIQTLIPEQFLGYYYDSNRQHNHSYLLSHVQSMRHSCPPTSNSTLRNILITLPQKSAFSTLNLSHKTQPAERIPKLLQTTWK